MAQLNFNIRHAFMALLLSISTFGFVPLVAADAELKGGIQETPDQHKQYLNQKSAILLQAMQLSSEESIKFWPVYERFAAQQDVLNGKLGRLLRGYAENVDSLTEEKAAKLTEEWLSYARARLKLLETYIPKFSRVLPATKVARLLQVVNRISLVESAEIAQHVPLAQ